MAKSFSVTHLYLPYLSLIMAADLHSACFFCLGGEKIVTGIQNTLAVGLYNPLWSTSDTDVIHFTWNATERWKGA